MRTPWRAVCVVPCCRRIIERRKLMCVEHWDLVPAHLRAAQEATARKWRHGPAMRNVAYGEWAALSYEALRQLLLHTWLDAFTLPTPADYARMPAENPHLESGERCWCAGCQPVRAEEGEPPCGCPLCLTVAYVSSKALENRRYVRVDQVFTGGDWRAPA